MMEVVTIYKTDYKELKGLTLHNVNPFFYIYKTDPTKLSIYYSNLYAYNTS